MPLTDSGSREVPDDFADGAAPHRRGFAWVVFLVALLVRLAYLYSIRDIPFIGSPTVDGGFYDEWAQRIAAGQWWGGDVFFLAPAYPYFLALIYALFGRSLLLVHVVQMVLGAGACAFVFHAGRRFFNEWAGRVAGVLLAVYPPAIFFDGIIHKANLLLFLTALLLFLLSSATGRRARRTWLVCGLVCGLLALTQENMIILFVVVPIWIFLRAGNGSRRVRWGHTTMFAGAMAALLVVVAIRNYAVGSVFALTTSNFGQNFYIGNHPEATGLYESFYHGRQDPVQEREDAIRIAEGTLGRQLTPAQASRFWFHRGLEFVDDRPGAWTRLFLRKVLLVWNRFEIPDAEDIAVYADWSPGLGLPVRFFHFGVLAPLGLTGIVLTWNRRSRVWVLYLLLAAITVSVALFFVFGRFRLPLAPVLAITGGAGIATLVSHFPMARVRPLLVGAGVLAVSALATNRPLLDERMVHSIGFVNLGSLLRQHDRLDEAEHTLHRAIDAYADSALAYYQLGLVELKRGRRAEAEANLGKSCALDPSFAGSHLALARMFAEQDRTEDAVAHYREAVRLKPDEKTPRLELARLLEGAGRRDEAIREFQLLARLAPDDGAVRDGLRRLASERRGDERVGKDDLEVLLRAGTDAAAVGRFAEAIEAYQKALERRPDDAKVQLALARVYVATERWTEAVSRLERALELEPDLLQTHIELGRILVDQGKFESGIAHDERAVSLDPTSIPAHYNLSTALAAVGRLGEAISAMEVCLELARTANRTELIPRIEDRLTRLRAQRAAP